MIETAWMELTSPRTDVLARCFVVSSCRRAPRHGRGRCADDQTCPCEPHPGITVGVHGGQVQWVKGNPFPIRVLDYDNDYGDAPDMDERGRALPCSIEPADKNRSRPTRSR